MTGGEPQDESRGAARERYERIYAILRTRICLLDYPPGQRLREEDLAEEFHVSRTPLRRVLGRLEDEGLLRSVHGVGTIVTDIDIDGLQQVYQLRVELAELVNLSPSPCLMRVKKLQSEGYISGYSAQINLGKIHLGRDVVHHRAGHIQLGAALDAFQTR